MRKQKEKTCVVILSPNETRRAGMRRSKPAEFRQAKYALGNRYGAGRGRTLLAPERDGQIRRRSSGRADVASEI
jgi:hypothetical protein